MDKQQTCREKFKAEGLNKAKEELIRRGISQEATNNIAEILIHMYEKGYHDACYDIGRCMDGLIDD